MTTGVTSITGFSENPYLTIAEYKNAPTSIDFEPLNLDLKNHLKMKQREE